MLCFADRRLAINPNRRGLNEGAARDPVHRGADDRIGGDALEKAGAAGHEENGDHRDGSEDRDDLLDAAFARAHLRDMLADRGAAVGAYAAALDDEVNGAFGAFDFGPQRHRWSLLLALL